MGRVVVVGSLNCDLVTRVPRRPDTGETVIATSFSTFVGGKGNNQALACARAGAEARIIGRMGDDAYADLIQQKLLASGVHCDFLIRDSDIGTGIANILVDAEGNNSIAIAPEANGRLTATDIDVAKCAFEGASHVLLQLEIPLEPVIRAAELAKKAGAMVVLNPAPAPASGKLPPDLLSRVDLIVPNQSEAFLLTGMRVVDVASAVEASRVLLEMGVRSVIVTLGEMGSVLAERGASAIHISPFEVDVVDTTAAGDAFCGALVASLAAERSLVDAARWASIAGALACTKLGAEPSLPHARDIDRKISASTSRPA